MDPRVLADRAERQTLPVDETTERFLGYGVMGLPFDSGHCLGLRRFPASTVGPGYTSIWHRDPAGAWTFYATVEPSMSCSRYFGQRIDHAVTTDIRLQWTGTHDLLVEAPSIELHWEIRLEPTLMTRAMNGVGRLLPESLWRNGPVLALMGAAASTALGAGRVRLRGRTPDGQWFKANPRLIWTIPATRAVLRGTDLGSPAPLERQEFMGDFPLTQRGIFAFGNSMFECLDPARHSTAVEGAGG